MIDFKSLTEFLSKISISDLGKHFTTISELYTKPLKSWRKIISYRKESYDFFLLFVLYYSIIVYFIISNSKYVIPITVLEVVLTLIPFSFLYFPFVFFRKKWNKRIKSNRLFRLLFVLKIQFNIILIAFLLLAKWTGMESIYVIIENYIILILFVFISVFPLLLKLKLAKKLLWIFTNYVFSLVFFVALFLFFKNIPDIKLLQEKITLKTPNSEHFEFYSNYNFSDLKLSNDYYIILLNSDKEITNSINTQFATTNLLLELMKLDKKNLDNKMQILDSIKQLPVNELKEEYIKLNPLKYSKVRLDSLKLNFNESFYNDLELTDSLTSKSNFKSNREFYKLLNEQLIYFDSIYKYGEPILKIAESEPKYFINTEDETYISIFELKDENLNNRKEQIQILREKIDNREKYSTLFQNIYFYPIEFIFELLD